MSSSLEKHEPPISGEPRQFEVKNHLLVNPQKSIDELSALIEALHSFGPDIFEVHFPEQKCAQSIEIGPEVYLPEQSCTRSIEIGSVEVWEHFVATLGPETTTQHNTRAQVLYNLIVNNRNLRYWIDLHPRDRRCLLHLKMRIGHRHEILLDTFTTAAKQRLAALPSLFPNNKDYLNALRQNIHDSRSANWLQLRNKIADSAFSFYGTTYGFPGFIIEVGDSQNWERDEGVRNKAAQYEDDSGGKISAVLYLGCRDRSIAMIGSKTLFPSSPPVKYLDGTASRYAVEFAYFGAGKSLIPSLEPEEHEMGFLFTFKEILQMMELVEKITPSSPQPTDAKKFKPSEIQLPWNSDIAIRASLFTTPPESLPYGPIEDLSADEESEQENSESSN